MTNETLDQLYDDARDLHDVMDYAAAEFAGCHSDDCQKYAVRLLAAKTAFRRAVREYWCALDD